MRTMTFVLTLLLTAGTLTSTALAQDEPAEAEKSSEETEGDEETESDDEGTEGDDEEAEDDEAADGEDEGARPATTKQDDEAGEENDDDTEPIDTEPTMFTKCSAIDAAPAGMSGLLFATLLVGLARRRRR